MAEKKDQKWLNENMVRLQEEFETFLGIKKRVKPWLEAFKIILLYLLIGCLWIALSDKILELLISDQETFQEIQLYKGWFYVFVTGIIFYTIIKRKMMLFENSIIKILDGYEELSTSLEELVAMNEELDSQNNLLENHRNALNSFAFYDTLTGLGNRALFEKELNEYISKPLQSGSKKMAVIYLDIDDFKHINDTMGHKMGDAYIKYAAKLLSAQITEPDKISRLGGDEFAILLADVKDENEIHDRVTSFLESIRCPFSIEDQSYFVTVSIGVSIYPDHADCYSVLMQNADTALYHRKENGKNGYSVFAQSMYETSLSFIQMRNQLTDAIKKEEFVLYYQPQIDLREGKLLGVEALIRWNHPQKGVVSPMDFIPFAERTGQIVEIDEWVLKTACKQKQSWEEAGNTPIKMAVNMSSQIVMQPGIVGKIRSILEQYHINFGELELEVTETAVMVELEKAKEVLLGLKDLGLLIALDDFGTGYSSLTYLQKLPFDVLKIDREFLLNVNRVDEEIYIFKAIVNLAHNLGLKVVAEGVETKAQKSFLIKNHCDIGQGYYFGKPMPAQGILALFQSESGE